MKSRKLWTTLGVTATLTTLQIAGLPNQKINEAQAHCRVYHPHHCTVPEVITDVRKTVDRYGLSIAHPYLIPVSGYLEFLFQQGNGRWQGLPDDFKACYRNYYSFNLDDVRYATNVNTIHGAAITVDSQIYFPSDVDLRYRNHRRWILHELEHVGQYQAVGGVSAFLLKYFVQGGIEVGRNGSINIHDNIGLERNADAKADRVLDLCSTSTASSREQQVSIVISIYKEILERGVDPSGMETWTNALKSGWTVAQVRRAIAESDESQIKLKTLYRRLLCRDMDPSGKTTWTNALANGWTLQRVANEGIVGSQEYQNRRGRSCN